ncbi:MAG: WG repeat-containing protein [Vagococcus sp.]
MKKCTSCGNKVIDNAKFCGSCGKPIGMIEDVEVSKIIVEPTHSTRHTIFKRIIPIMIVVSVIGVSAGYLLSGSKSASVTSEDLNTHLPFSKKEKGKKASKKKKKPVIHMMSYKNGEHYGLIDSNLSIINEDIGDQAVTYNAYGIGAKLDDDVYQLLDSKGEEIEPYNLKTIGTFNGPVMSNTASEMASKNGVLDYSIVADDTDSDGNDKYLRGLIDAKGNIVKEAEDCMIFPFNGKKITQYSKFTNKGIISEEGDVIIEPIYYDAVVLTDTLIATKKTESDTLYDVMDLEGNIVEKDFAETIYPYYNQDNLITVGKATGKYGLYSDKLEEIIAPTFSSGLQVSQNQEYVVFQEKDKFGLMDIKGHVLIDPIYNSLSVPNETGVLAFNKGDSDYGLLDTKGNVISDDFSTNPFPEYGTNLFLETREKNDDYYVYVYDSKGEIVLKEKGIIGTHRKTVPGVYVHWVMNNDNTPKTKVFTQDGQLIGDDVTMLADLGDTVFIQEDDHLMIKRKTDGKIMKEKTI